MHPTTPKFDVSVFEMLLCCVICVDGVCVNENLGLCRCLTYTHDPLRESVCRKIFDAARQCMMYRDKCLGHMTEFKIVRENKVNYLNVRLRREYTNVIFTYPKGGLLFVFMPSDKFEPVVVVIALHCDMGRLNNLTREDVQSLNEAIVTFKQKFDICGDEFLYTDRTKRRGCGYAHQRPHSTHFHLKILLPVNRYVEVTPTMSQFGDTVARMSHEIEALRYHASRIPYTWSCLERILLFEAEHDMTFALNSHGHSANDSSPYKRLKSVHTLQPDSNMSIDAKIPKFSRICDNCMTHVQGQ